MLSDPQHPRPAVARDSAWSWLWLSLLVLVVDQITKTIASAGLVYLQPVPVLPGFNLTLVHNPGAAFSFLSDAGGWQRWLFSVIAALVSLFLVWWLRQVQRGDWRQALPLALILAGAVGNLIDRLRFGYVVDFVDLYWGDRHWPAFNVADAGISIGAVLLIWFSLLDLRRGVR